MDGGLSDKPRRDRAVGEMLLCCGLSCCVVFFKLRNIADCNALRETIIHTYLGFHASCMYGHGSSARLCVCDVHTYTT